MNEPEIAFLMDALKDSRCRTVVDVGCHKAEFARPFLDAGYRVIGLEPNVGDPELKACLDKVDGLELLPMAASNHDGNAEMFIGEHVATNTLEKKWTETAFPKTSPTAALSRCRRLNSRRCSGEWA